MDLQRFWEWWFWQMIDLYFLSHELIGANFREMIENVHAIIEWIFDTDDFTCINYVRLEARIKVDVVYEKQTWCSQIGLWIQWICGNYIAASFVIGEIVRRTITHPCDTNPNVGFFLGLINSFIRIICTQKESKIHFIVSIFPFRRTLNLTHLKAAGGISWRNFSPWPLHWC